MQLLWAGNGLPPHAQAHAHARMHTRRLGTFVRCSRERRSPFGWFFFPSLPAATVIPCFYCLSSSFVLLVWLCSHCPMPKLAEEPDKHAAHTSGLICGIFPAHKQLTPSNEHTLLLLQLCHHNYWPKSAPSHHLPVAVFSMGTNWGTGSKVSCVGTFGREMFRLHSRRCHPLF